MFCDHDDITMSTPPIYIMTRRGIVSWYCGRAVLLPRDERRHAGVTKKRPCGYWCRSPVIGFRKAVRRGIIRIDFGSRTLLPCGCCWGYESAVARLPDGTALRDVERAA